MEKSLGEVARNSVLLYDSASLVRSAMILLSPSGKSTCRHRRKEMHQTCALGAGSSLKVIDWIDPMEFRDSLQ